MCTGKHNGPHNKYQHQCHYENGNHTFISVIAGSGIVQIGRIVIHSFQIFVLLPGKRSMIVPKYTQKLTKRKPTYYQAIEKVDFLDFGKDESF